MLSDVHSMTAMMLVISLTKRSDHSRGENIFFIHARYRYGSPHTSETSFKGGHSMTAIVITNDWSGLTNRSELMVLDDPHQLPHPSDAYTLSGGYSMPAMIMRLTNRSDHSRREEQRLAEAPVGSAADVAGRGHAAVAGADHFVQ